MAETKQEYRRPASRKVRLAMLGSMPPQRGISTYCRELADALSGRVELDVVSFRSMYPGWLYPGREQPLDETFPDAGGENYRIRTRLTWWNPLTWFAEGLFAAADVLHAQFWSLPLLPLTLTVMLLFRVRRKGVVLTVHNVSSREYDRLYQIGLGLLVRAATSVVVHTTAQAEELVARHPASSQKVVRIPHGVLRAYRDQRLDQPSARQILDLPKASRVVLFFGAIRPYKGLDVLLEAFSEVVRAFPDAMLLVAGKPWGTWEPYQRLIREHGLESRVACRLEYVPTDQVASYFAAADLAVFPYREFSAQSGAALAAIGCDLPIVATDVGGLRDLVLNRNCLAPPGDAAQLAKSMLTALRDDTTLKRLRADSATVASEYHWDGIAEKLVALYCSLTPTVRPKAESIEGRRPCRQRGISNEPAGRRCREQAPPSAKVHDAAD